MKKMNFTKYQQYPQVEITERTWPNQIIKKAPLWVSVDLRDGNQALSIPMSIEEKLQMFKLLVAIGFKQIEVAFPAAAQVEFDFVRCLIEQGHIPDDVTIQVLTQAREHLIKRTFAALQGVKQAIVHVYNSTSTAQRRVVFKQDKAGIKKIATDAARLMVDLRQEMIGSQIQFEYSPESFTGTELDYALEICEAVIDIWQPTIKNKVIINLPSTVEMSTPNIYADRIEWFSQKIKNRETIVLSVHPHNDRGTAVAAGELSIMAGAERVEGSLFGNGERTGNMDIITIAMNLYSRGIDPKLDFSNIDKITEIYSRCTRLEVQPRHPYAGELVYTAFSGSHQDAINKGLKAQQAAKNKPWDVPYLPIDPQDVGRDYKSIIRINSQSGKGGLAYIMEKDWGFHIPKKMQPDFAQVVQRRTETLGRELSSAEVKNCFRDTYFNDQGKYRLTFFSERTNESLARETFIHAVVSHGQLESEIKSKGNGPLDAFTTGLRRYLGITVEIVMYEEHALRSGADAEAIAYVGLKFQGKEIFGSGIDCSISLASIKAVLSAVNHGSNNQGGKIT
jgi:2-isopropylmalate synthase